MSKDLEDLVGFINHGNTPLRQLAIQNLVPYSVTHPHIFKKDQLTPVKHLKLLTRDYPQIAKNVLDILINLSTDPEILEELVGDDLLLENLLGRVTHPEEPNANLHSMLLANLAKKDEIKKLLEIERAAPSKLGSNARAIDQLLDLFVKGADGTYNKNADFDYLAYLFADIAKHEEGRKYFITKQDYDGVIPITKLIVFTEHKSDVRRKGVASTIKNVAFDIPFHATFLAEDGINILPYLLLPIMGSEEFEEEDMLDFLPDLQLLPPDKTRDSDPAIMQTHIETLTLLATTREGRDKMRAIKVYPIIRETHLQVEDDGVREACERLVQVLMRGEEGEEDHTEIKMLDRGVKKEQKRLGGAGDWATQEKEKDKEEEEEEEDDDEITEV